MSIPLIFPIKQIIDEAPNVKSYVFEHKLNAKPGQFVMVWMPGTDEVPMSVGWQTETEFTLTIAMFGDCTKAIHEKISVGDKLGIRGPYGHPFTFDGYKNILLLGGGCGAPPMLNLAQQARKAGLTVKVLLGGRTKDHLLFEEKFKSLGCTLRAATNDGSNSYKGFATDFLKEELEQASPPDCLYACGPEIMLVKTAQAGQDYNIPSQVNMERYMKCGFGICGQCCLDDSGLRICKEGPVLDGNLALKHPEFGKYKRDAAGVRVNFN